MKDPTLAIAARTMEAFRQPLCWWQKALLIAGLVWALAVIVPDFTRLYSNLSQFDFSADNSGLIYQVDTPDAASGKAKIVLPYQQNDSIDLSPAPCWRPTSQACQDYLAVFGGMGGLSWVKNGTAVTLPIVPAGGGRAHEVHIVAHPEPLGVYARIMLGLDELAGVLVVLLAFELAWRRPGAMTAGFFLYAMWFNPGQYFAFYAWLQNHPVWFLVQEVCQALAQGAGYAGFAIFALRFPHDRTEANLRGVERLAIGLGAVLALLQLLSFANVFGFPTEDITRAAILGGYAVALFAFYIVWRRSWHQHPLEYQRMRWVLWGCAIGLPTFIFADINEATSLPARYIWPLAIWNGWTPDESVLEACYLVSGILAIFICFAIKRRRILNVTFELRALVITVAVLVVGAMIEDLMHIPISAGLHTMGFPERLQFYISVVPLALCSYAAHQGAHAANHVLNRGFYHASLHLDEVGDTAKRAESLEAIDAILADGPSEALELASAAVFRERDGAFEILSPPKHWSLKNPVKLVSPFNRLLVEKLREGDAVRLPLPYDDDAPGEAILVPALAVPVILAEKLYAIVMYGPHETGADFDKWEVTLLENFAKRVAVGYETLTKALLEAEVERLRKELGAKTGSAST